MSKNLHHLINDSESSDVNYLYHFIYNRCKNIKYFHQL